MSKSSLQWQMYTTSLIFISSLIFSFPLSCLIIYYQHIAEKLGFLLEDIFVLADKLWVRIDPWKNPLNYAAFALILSTFSLAFLFIPLIIAIPLSLLSLGLLVCTFLDLKPKYWNSSVSTLSFEYSWRTRFLFVAIALIMSISSLVGADADGITMIHYFSCALYPPLVLLGIVGLIMQGNIYEGFALDQDHRYQRASRHEY